MRTWQKALGGAATALLLAGCGGGDGGDGGGFADESAEDIQAASEKDMKALSAVTMKGDVTDDGQKIGLDLALSTSGNCHGTIEIQGGSAEILSVDGASWMKADGAFWQAAAGENASMVQQVVGDKWVVLPPEEGGFSELCDLDSLLDEMGADDDENAGEVQGTEDVGGQETVRIDTKTDEGDPLSVWVAAEEPHYIVKMEVTKGKEPGTVTFSDFDEDVDVQAPADDEVIDLAKMGG